MRHLCRFVKPCGIFWDYVAQLSQGVNRDVFVAFTVLLIAKATKTSRFIRRFLFTGEKMGYSIKNIPQWQQGGAVARNMTPLGYFGAPAEYERDRQEVREYFYALPKMYAEAISGFLESQNV
jgi:hypothetical protein